MNHPGYRLGVVASSNSLIESVRRIAAELDDDIRIVHVVGMDEAVAYGKQMQAEGVEVIISRRGTAHFLRENLRIPVLSFPVSSLNILGIIREAKNYGRNILFPVFRKKLDGLEIFEEVFKISLHQNVYHDSRSLKRIVCDAERRGIHVIIGGGSTIYYADSCGLPGLEITVAEDVVASTIEDAKSVAKANRQEQARAELYHCIIESNSDGIIAVEDNGKISSINQAAQNIFKIKPSKIENLDVTRFLPMQEFRRIMKKKIAVQDKLVKINGDRLLISHIPVTVGKKAVGLVSTFKDISNVMRAENKVRRSFTKGLVAKYFIDDFIYQGSPMKDVITKAKRFAQSDSTLLISGETGTGKELLAQSIHNLSRRKKGPFIGLNCAALPDQLLESELFGYEEGAFTGSRKGGKPGLFELAHNGTIFLDEIDATPHSVQIRLLRVLQEREVMRIGGDRLIPIDVRVISAAGWDLSERLTNNKMREDLFFRLHVLPINLPPLRERLEDLPLLVKELIRRISDKYGLPVLEMPDSQKRMLMDYHWPGNVRQLENFLERMVLLCDGYSDDRIFDELYEELIKYPKVLESADDDAQPSTIADLNLDGRDIEAQRIDKALKEARYSKSKAAKILGISRTTLWRKLKTTSGPDRDHGLLKNKTLL